MEHWVNGLHLTEALKVDRRDEERWKEAEKEGGGGGRGGGSGEKEEEEGGRGVLKRGGANGSRWRDGWRTRRSA